MKTALHTVSYAGVWIGQHRLTVEQIISRAAEFGYDGIMLMAKRPHASVLDVNQEARARLRGLLQDKGLGLACIAGYNDFGAGADRPDVPLLEMQIAHVTELAGLARDLGGSIVRGFTSFERPQLTYDQLWDRTAQALRECARRASDFGVTVGVQNHHDLASHSESLYALLKEIDHPNCRAMFDAWTLFLQGDDLAAAVRRMAPYIVHTTVADYVRRPRFVYQPQVVNFARQHDQVKAVPPGEGEVDYRAFFKALKEVGYNGYVAYEMCSVLDGGGSEANLDRYARRFLEYFKSIAG